MNIDLSQYSGKCGCGRKHNLLTKEIIIEAGAIGKLGDIAGGMGLLDGVIICDENTLHFAERARGVLGGERLLPEPIIALNPVGLHADEKATALICDRLSSGAKYLIAMGSGTIHDVTRYVANDRGIPFISCPTAATVDGFVSTVSAMTWYGFKKTLPGIAPLAVIADTDIFAAAPYNLTASGIGDVIGKFTSIADWQISHILTGEELCPRIRDITLEAVTAVRDNLTGIKSGDSDSMERLMFALLLSGIAMQMNGNSRPASGAEHHLSHLWEMQVINPHINALHGEKVGVGEIIALKRYKQAAASNAKAAPEYRGIPVELLKNKFGRLYDDIKAENNPDPLADITPEKLNASMPEIIQVIEALPNPLELEAELITAGCHTKVTDIELSEDIIPDSMALSPFVRNRLTFMRVIKLLG